MASQYSDPEEAEIDFPLHPYKVGDLVIMKWWSDDSSQHRWNGPFKVNSITFSSLKVDGVKKWVHHTEVRRYVPSPPEEEKKESECLGSAAAIEEHFPKPLQE